MNREMWKKRSAFELWVLALTAATLVLMIGWFIFGSVRPSDTWRVEVERTDSPEYSASTGEHEQTDSLLEGEVIDLNTAGVADLERLPGIGSARARAIVEHRQEHGTFRLVEDMLNVDGIGPGILGQVRPYIKVE